MFITGPHVHYRASCSLQGLMFALITGPNAFITGPNVRRSLFANEPCNKWQICGRRITRGGILWVVTTLQSLPHFFGGLFLQISPITGGRCAEWYLQEKSFCGSISPLDPSTDHGGFLSANEPYNKWQMCGRRSATKKASFWSLPPFSPFRKCMQVSFRNRAVLRMVDLRRLTCKKRNLKGLFTPLMFPSAHLCRSLSEDEKCNKR